MNKGRFFQKKIRELLKRKGGFTFTELLVATLIMVLATGALTSALALAIRHFYRSTQRTEAQFLCASLAEFVEDELSFASVSETPEDLKWSKGTHNMGSNISFFICQEDGATYTPVGDSTLGTYGKLAITGDNYRKESGENRYFHAISDGAYEVEPRRGYSLLASMSLKWDTSNQWYAAEIRAVDKSSKKLLSSVQFTVKPAAKKN